MPDDHAAEHLQRLERMYLAAPVNRLYAPAIHIDRGCARVGFLARGEHFHAGGALHGSVYFKALDDAAFFAAASLVHDVMVLTASFTVYLLRPITGGRLQADGRVVSRSRNLIVAEAVLTLDSGKTAAKGSGTFMPGRTRLMDVAAYREPLAE